MARTVALLALIFPVAFAVRSSQSVTPVEKVIELLGRLSAKVEEEGKAEAAAYDKYACFCKEQADEKQYSIEKSTKEIAAMAAQITDLDAEITGLNTDISGLVSDIADLKEKITNITDARALAHGNYTSKNNNVTGAIDAVERAIEAMEQSKDELKGDAKADLLQVQEFAAAIGAPSFEYQSNDIISTLKELRKTFIQRKNTQDQEEFEANSIFEKKKLGLSNEKKFAAKTNGEKQEIASDKSEKLADVKEAKAEETDAKDADVAFLGELTSDCQSKAVTFDSRSQTRTAELTACAQAMEYLKGDVAKNFGANKKLTGLISKKQAVGHWAWVDAKPASFLQLRGSRGSSEAPIKQVLEQLSNAATSMGSSVLSLAVLKARSTRSSEDHFVKVRQIITDLVAKLKQDGLDEATEKSYCDTNVAAATTKRDSKNELVEDLAGQISTNEAKKDRLMQEIAGLSKNIADNNKALAEANELRDSEKLENDQTLADATAGKAAVDMAISILKTFYDDNALIQQSSGNSTSPATDRHGNTLGDIAPKVHGEGYKGGQTESVGILGMLAVIQSDYERTMTQVTADEAEAVTKFNSFKTATDLDTTNKNTARTGKDTLLITTEDTLVDNADDKKTAGDARDAALADLEVLHERCVQGEESYQARVEKREKEIQALKDAMKILEEWQN